MMTNIMHFLGKYVQSKWRKLLASVEMHKAQIKTLFFFFKVRECKNQTKKDLATCVVVVTVLVVIPADVVIVTDVTNDAVRAMIMIVTVVGTMIVDVDGLVVGVDGVGFNFSVHLRNELVAI